MRRLGWIAPARRDGWRRSGLIAGQLIGFALLRYVWKIEPIASMSDDEVVAALAPNLQRYLDGDLSYSLNGCPHDRKNSSACDSALAAGVAAAI